MNNKGDCNMMEGNIKKDFLMKLIKDMAMLEGDKLKGLKGPKIVEVEIEAKKLPEEGMHEMPDGEMMPDSEMPEPAGVERPMEDDMPKLEEPEMEEGMEMPEDEDDSLKQLVAMLMQKKAE